MFCKACGNEVLDTAVICPKCGSAVGGSSGVSTPLPKSTLIIGWICAVIFPIVGVIIGILAIVKKNYENGIGMLVLSCFMWMLWAVMWM